MKTFILSIIQVCFISLYSFADPPVVLVTTETTELCGTRDFHIYVKASNLINVVDHSHSSNVTFLSRTWEAPSEYLFYYDFIYRITGEQSGWIQLSYVYESTTYYLGPIPVYRKLNSVNLIDPDVLLCNLAPATYYEVDEVDNAAETYTWTVSSGLQIEYGGQNYSTITISDPYVNISAKSTGSGNQTIKIKANAEGYVSSEETTKTITVGKPVVSNIDGPLYTPNNQWADYNAELTSMVSPPDDYTWILNPLNGNSVYDYGISCDIAFYNSGYYQLIVQAHNQCGWGDYYVTGVEVYDSRSLSISPNPAYGEAILTIESGGKKEFSVETEWELEVYSETQILKERKTQLKGKEYRINTSGWKDGVYMVRIKYKDEILTGKLIVGR